MAWGIGRSIQLVIDKVRGKKRGYDPADRFSGKPWDGMRLAADSGELTQIFYAHDGRIARKWHHDFEVYDRHFSPLRAPNPAIRILEIGVSRGGSLQIWRKYFGKDARIVGVDIDPARAARVEPGTHFVAGDQSDPVVLAKGPITSTASGKQVDPEQQKFVNKEQESAGAGETNTAKEPKGFLFQLAICVAH